MADQSSVRSSVIWGLSFLVGIHLLTVPVHADERLFLADADSESGFPQPLVPITQNGLVQDPPSDTPRDLPISPLNDLIKAPVYPGPPLQPTQPVNIVTRQPSTVGRSAAAVFVVTPEMIRRSGARSVPELLRMVPGLYVARIDSSKWSVSSRGFSSRFARKLLTQIDGRTVYTSVFGGTFWDVKDVMLKDVERIEVIRGPGATLWGANAVNGIVNVITKSAAKTHGTYVETGGGTEERNFSGVRLGGVSDKGVNYRVYSKWFDRDRQFQRMGNAHDDWRQGRVGFRTDWSSEDCDTLTTLGEYYGGTNGIANEQPLFGLQVGDEPVAGGHLLSRWTHKIDEDRDTTFQVYYDRTDRRSLGFEQNVNVFDIDFQYRMPLGERNKLIWGLGYRRIWDRLTNSRMLAPLAMSPTERTTERFSAFVQDEFTLVEDSLFFTFGTKIGDNTFTDFQVQPSARLLWLPDKRSSAWMSVSRAVRNPSRAAHDAQLIIADVGGIIPVNLRGSRDLVSEDMMAYEIGYRRQPVDWFSWDLAMFFNVDQNLITTRAAPGPTALQFFNGGEARSYGVELAAQLQVTENWRLFGWYTFFRLNADFSPESAVPSTDAEGGDPRHQVFLMSSWDLRKNVQFDLISRYVDNVSSLDVASYISMDLRLAWRPKKNLELSLVGQNLLDSHHPEYGKSIFVREVPTEVQRGAYAMLTYEF